MKTGYRNLLAMTVMCLMMGAAASPARRSQDIEARRRSAVDRSLIRSYPAEPSAADIRELLQRPVRRGTSFLRLGRSQPLNSDDIISLLKSYEEYEEPSKRGTTFMRLGRSPQFMRLGRSGDKPEETGYQERKSRARDQFLRLGRDSEEFSEVDEEDEESRKKRDTCPECQA
ncbi:FMRFamide-related peptides-like isoform X2 [Leguminivora glycinivorella]|uniref:FMRFamide-related peptides-like isoform X2 n=1 Tax=Leguminivora glycinivorella TaxID=1035111 RepID=UPI00200E473D|nr:FMRFamide-related peptides-like isoform X2 [Leguminivora glycinivorella]